MNQADFNLVILYGGKSSEHEVSLLSAASVIRHAPWPDAAITLVGLDPEGRWYLQDAAMVSRVRAGAPLEILPGPRVLGQPSKGLLVEADGRLKEVPVSVVFPVLHGTNGEDGIIQGYLQTLDLPYVGSGVLGSAMGMDKEKAKQAWMARGLPVVPYRCILRSAWRMAEADRWWKEVSEALGSLVFVKPARGGSSVGISKATDRESFVQALTQAFRYDTKVLVEAAVNAREVEISVTGNDQPQAWVPGEIIPHHEFYDYDAKYLDPDGAALVIPAPVDPALEERIRITALEAYRAVEARGLARVDFFVTRERGELFINEINTLPGFTAVSMFPMMCEAGGLSYPDLIAHLVSLAQEEARDQRGLSTQK